MLQDEDIIALIQETARGLSSDAEKTATGARIPSFGGVAELQFTKIAHSPIIITGRKGPNGKLTGLSIHPADQLTHSAVRSLFLSIA